MDTYMRGAWAAGLAVSLSSVAIAQQAIELTTDSAVLDGPFEVVLHLQPWSAGQVEMPRNCVQAELRYGEFALPASQVHTRVEPAADADRLRVVVSSPLVVNEPLVHLRVALTCEPRLERHWTLFADPAPALPAAMATAGSRDGIWLDSVAGLAAPAPGPGRARSAAPIANAEPTGTAPTDTASIDGAAPERAPRAGVRAARRSASPRRTAEAAGRRVAGPSAVTSRLSIEAADIDVLARAVARLVLDSPRPAATESAPLEALRQQLAQLRQENDALRASTLALQARLEQLMPLHAATHQAAHGPHAEAAPASWTGTLAWTARDAGPWLVALLAAGALAWTFRSLGRRADALRAREDIEPPRPRRRASASATAVGRSRPVVQAWPGPARAAEPAPPPPAAPPLLPVAATVDPTLSADQQALVQQLVDDGQLDALAAVLEYHLHAGPARSAPLLLDLLDLYQRMDRDTDRRRVADELVQHFNVRITHGPDDLTTLEEAHPATLASIAAGWQGPDVPAAIRNLMLRPTAVEELTLRAFREVLALYRLVIERAADESTPVPDAADAADATPAGAPAVTDDAGWP